MFVLKTAPISDAGGFDGIVGTGELKNDATWLGLLTINDLPGCSIVRLIGVA